MSYQQRTRFRTTVDFDREYLWNGSSNRQAKTALSATIFSTFDENTLVNFSLYERKWWPWLLTYIG